MDLATNKLNVDIKPTGDVTIMAGYQGSKYKKPNASRKSQKKRRI